MKKIWVQVKVINYFLLFSFCVVAFQNCGFRTIDQGFGERDGPVEEISQNLLVDPSGGEDEAADSQIINGQEIVLPAELPAEIESLVDELIFFENFDDQPDWFVEKNGRCLSGQEEVCSSIPQNWNFYYTGEKWHPDDEQGSNFQPSAQISSFQHRGPSGKSYITFDESYGSPSQWGSDASLATDLGGNYKDVYFEFWFKFQPNYRWSSTLEGFGINSNKMARLSSYYGSPDGSRFQFLQGGRNTPMAHTQLKVETGRSGRERTLLTSTVRCSPVDSNYKCERSSEPVDTVLDGQLGDYIPFLLSVGDGNWHKWGFRVKYNSAPGVADGILQAWIDDVKVQELNQVTFLGPQVSDVPEGFNIFMIGGNMNNIPEPEISQYEQWLAYDDVRVFSLKD